MRTQPETSLRTATERRLIGETSARSRRGSRRPLLAGRVIVVAIILSVIAFPSRMGYAQPGAPWLSAPDAVIIDGWTGSVLYAKNADTEHDPASTVKIMTALIVLERVRNLRRVLMVRYDAATIGGSTAGLYTGERLTFRNALFGMLLPSGNDAAIALADATAGTSTRFVTLMNTEASRLHLWHTHYLTPNGFDAWGQVSTAHDLAELARVAMQERLFARIVRTRSWSVRDAGHRLIHHWYNLNKLLWSSPEVDGIKTGTTPGAGACLVSSVQRDGKWVIAVNLGSTEASRFHDGLALLNYGLAIESAAPSTH